MVRAPLELPVTIEDSGKEAVVVVTVGPDAVAEWLLQLCLLRYRLISGLTIVDSGGASSKLWIGLEDGDELASRFRWSADGPLVYVTGEGMDYWIHFFLDYYTTGRSPVDHIDVLPEPDPSEKRGDLQIVFQLRQRDTEPVSKQKRNRRSRKR